MLIQRDPESSLLPDYPVAVLALADGRLFRGYSIGAPARAVGEVVFNTAMTGYQEILTDPSYSRQLVTLTYPHIGNTGINAEDVESTRIHAQALIVRDVPQVHSNFRAAGTLGAYLHEQRIPGIAGIDTRSLTRHLRDHGAQAGCLIASDNTGVAPDNEAAVAAAREFAGLAGMDLAREVSTAQPYNWNEGTWLLTSGYQSSEQITAQRTAGNDAPPRRFKVVAMDFGVKHNILRLLADRGCDLVVLPAQASFEQVIAHDPDGVFLSNGPGDPEPCDYAIQVTRAVLERAIPIFGICLGHQILALACGARTVKMKLGHHGANHPVKDLDSGQVLITSQNHGFAVDEQALPAHLRLTHKSLFDGTVQGLAHNEKPAFGFQGHPEASPGPHDIRYLFDRFIDLMARHEPEA